MQLDVSKYYLIRPSTGTAVLAMRGPGNDGMGAPIITGGGAQYTTVNRPRRTAITYWTGDLPFTMDVPILFDGWTGQKIAQSVEQDVARVEQMRHSQSAGSPPPTLLIDGALPVKGARWVITNIAWGATNVIWMPQGTNKGYRVQQDGVLSLQQMVTEQTLQLANPPNQVRLHSVRAGETLAGIAKDAKITVAAIKQFNNIRDPKTIKIGDLLRLPPASGF